MIMYFKILFFAGVTLMLTFTSCNHNLDPILAEAQTVQDEAIDLGIRVDSIIYEKLIITKDTSTIQLLNKVKSEITIWRSSMVAVPGSKHKCNHDHGEHIHIEGSDASHLTPAENKKVQEEWKEAIEIINEQVK